MALTPRNEDENTKTIKKKLSQIETHFNQIGDDFKQEPTTRTTTTRSRRAEAARLSDEISKLENNEQAEQQKRKAKERLRFDLDL